MTWRDTGFDRSDRLLAECDSGLLQVGVGQTDGGQVRAPEHQIELGEPEHERVAGIDDRDLDFVLEIFRESRRQLQAGESCAQDQDGLHGSSNTASRSDVAMPVAEYCPPIEPTCAEGLLWTSDHAGPHTPRGFASAYRAAVSGGQLPSGRPGLGRSRMGDRPGSVEHRLRRDTPERTSSHIARSSCAQMDLVRSTQHQFRSCPNVRFTGTREICRYLVKRPGQNCKGEAWRSMLASCSVPDTERTTRSMRSI